MKKLIHFELKKQFPSVKNLVVWLLLFVTLLTFGAINMITDYRYKGMRLGYDGSAWDAALQLNLLLQTYPKDPPENIQLAMELWRRDAVYSAQQRVFSAWVGEDRWRDVVLANINRNENILQGLRDGIISGKTKAEGGVTEADLINNINLNRYFFDNDIKPLRSANEMTGVNFIYQAFSVLMPYLAAAVVLLLCGDCFTSEMDSGSFKFLLLQPYPRSKVFSAKILSCLIITFTVISSSTLAVFLIMSAFNGTGSIAYPLSFDPYAFSSITVTPQSEILEYLGAGQFLLYTFILFTLYIVFLISFAGIASVLSQESLNAMTVSISVFFAAAVLQPPISRIPVISLLWPLSYGNAITTLEGRAPGSMLAGILIFVLASSIVLIASRTIFIKKDIAC
ncbi:MAG: ABC transporter permease subunit [Clostridiales bacterium]|nr:ABC transporter permease subunit [Clostridiales bacterium]